VEGEVRGSWLGKVGQKDAEEGFFFLRIHHLFIHAMST
jgi:hypothetical protein